jgi:predicted solute-binding protein
MQIGIINNLAAAPYRLMAPPPEAAILLGSPSGVWSKFRDGECAAALLPVVCLSRLGGRVEPLKAFGIGCHGRVGSVLFLARRGIDEIIRGSGRVHLPPNSQTSRELFRVLCKMTYDRTPLECADPEDAEGVLLIGNHALTAKLSQAWPIVVDLGQWWAEQTGLPFVFARWVVSSTTDEQAKADLSKWLEGCERLAQSKSGLAQLSQAAEALIPDPRTREEYFAGIDVRLTERHLEGLEVFLQLLPDTG